jgi:PIN like domain
MLTRDRRIRYRKNELRALVDSKLMMFVLTQGGLSAEETGRIVCAAYAAIVKQAAQNEAPALFSVLRSGEVNKLKLSA